MDFSVEPAKLRELAALLDRARQHVEASAAYYEIESEGTPWFGDPLNPQGHLDKEPGDYHDELASSMSWWDAASPMSWCGEAIKQVSYVAVWLDHPYHPQEQLAKQFVGNWVGARAAADVLRNVGRAVNEIAIRDLRHRERPQHGHRGKLRRAARAGHGESMTWRTVVSSGVYGEYLERGIAAMRDLDFDATFASVPSEEPPQPGRTERDEDEPFTRNVLKRRR